MHDGGLSEIVEWTLSGDNPAATYLLARGFLAARYSPDDLEEMRRRTLSWEPLARILAHQREDGGFPCPENRPTERSTLMAMCIMARCGLNSGDRPVRRILDYVQANCLKKGAFSYTGGGSGVLPCYVGVFVDAVASLDGWNSPVAASSRQWLIDHQRFDHKEIRGGGARKWPFKAVDNHGGCWWSVSCFHGVVAAMRALASVPPGERSAAVADRLNCAIEYLRIHRVYKKSSGDRPLFRHLKQFFLLGGYRTHLIDVLEGVAMTDPGLVRESWVQEAVRDVDSLAVGGRIPLMKNYRSRIVDPLPLEIVGEPSRFLTCQWLAVKRRFGLV